MMTSRNRLNRHAPDATATPLLSVSDLVLAFTQRLAAAAELAAMERGKAIIDSLFSQLAAQGHSFLGKAATKQADRDRNQVVAGLTRQFLDALEKPLRARVHEKLSHELAHAPSAPSRERAGEGDGFLPGLATARTPVRRKARQARPNLRLPPPLDPEQIKRDQEFVRLRALLRPVAVETIVPEPAQVFVAPPVQVQRPASPGDVLRALEKEIQNAVPTLGTLGPERCGAQIAAWVGQVRGLRDRLPPDVSATMRPAFRIFLEHLTQLRDQMETHMVDALEPNWKAPDWDAYVEINRARAEQRAPELSIDRRHNYHRAMLRALVLPHRRNVPAQAAAIINAAAESLHPEDSLLQSAIRRHRSAMPSQAPAEKQDPATASPVADAPAAQTGRSPDGAVSTVPAPNTAPAAPVTAENEFDSTWTK
jgi:hypothetical protein